MKKNRIAACTVALLSLTGSVSAQTPFTDVVYLDVNQFKAGQSMHGFSWYNPATYKPSCEYPKGSGKHVTFLGSIWMSGADEGGTVHVSAQNYAMADYWPGPLNASGILDYPTSTDWARIWKIERSDISTFLALTSRTTSTVPAVILEWPAKGNPFAKGRAGAALTITDEMAPFVDTDHDGIYNPLNGDYPDMKGDQMLWWVFSDNGPSHVSKGAPLMVQYNAMAYGYKRNSDVDRVLFYEFTMINKSPHKYTNFRFGLFNDVDLGNPNDDYLAFDSSFRMGMVYNARIPDEPNGLNSYGDHPPISALSFVEMPGDIYPSGMMPPGTFNYYERTFVGEYAEPQVDTQFYNIMHAKGSYGEPRSFGNYAYPTTLGAVQCDSNHPLADRRYLITSNDYAFQPNTRARIAMAIMATDTNGNACGGHLNFKEMTDLADTAWRIYYNPLPPLAAHDPLLAAGFKIYPVPATDQLYIETGTTAKPGEQLEIIDALGRRMPVPVTRNSNRWEADLRHLTPGMYALVYSSGDQRITQRFLKK